MLQPLLWRRRSGGGARRRRGRQLSRWTHNAHRVLSGAQPPPPPHALRQLRQQQRAPLLPKLQLLRGALPLMQGEGA